MLREIRVQIPSESVLYFADQGHVPYGQRTLEEVRAFSEEITRFLLDLGAKLIVVACNAASAAALHHLRQTFPDNILCWHGTGSQTGGRIHPHGRSRHPCDPGYLSGQRCTHLWWSALAAE